MTTEEMLEKLGLKSARTLRHWRELGLIPSPTVKPHPSGRGRIAMWPTVVLDRCIQIRKQLREGKTLAEIGKLPRQRRTATGSPAKEQQELQHLRLAEGVTRQLRNSARQLLRLKDQEVVTAEHLQEANRIMRTGFTPALIVTDAWSKVVAVSSLECMALVQQTTGVIVIISLKDLITK